MREIREKYPYLYETHLHTREASACAKNSAQEMVQAAKDYGYAGIFVTNHAWYGNTSVDRSLPWEEWVHGFCAPFYTAKAYGDQIGLSVFFGYESCYQGTEFLIYGVDEEWLLTHPEYLILDEPTRGIDVGTKVDIQKLVLKLAGEGMSVTFISSETDEMLRTCSRLIVMRDRKVVGELSGEDLTQNKIMSTIAGGEK